MDKESAQIFVKYLDDEKLKALRPLALAILREHVGREAAKKIKEEKEDESKR